MCRKTFATSEAGDVNFKTEFDASGNKEALKTSTKGSKNAGDAGRCKREILIATFACLVGWSFCFICMWVHDGSPKQPQDLSLYASTAKANKEYDYRILPKDILAKRPNWRTDFDLKDWIPKWMPTRERWESTQENSGGQEQDSDANDDQFWKTVAADFTFGGAPGTGVGHRLAHLSYSYICNGVPNHRQQLVHWQAPGLNEDNRAWHYLFDDSPVVKGVPSHWTHQQSVEHVNQHRNATGTMGALTTSSGSVNQGLDFTHGDFQVYYNFESAGGWCQGYQHPRDLWLLRFAKEPSAQEFYQTLRAQFKQHVKDKVATFMEQHFPKDKLVIGVHIRSGNGKDDGQGHFDVTHRGDWLVDLPAAITTVRRQIRMIAYSILDRMNMGGDLFDKDEYDALIDERHYRIFLATDSSKVVEEFQRQDPNVLTFQQDRVKDGEGVAIGIIAECTDTSDSIACAVRTQEAIFLDMAILSSCDATLAGSYSNFMYSMPAALSMAEGRIFCETGRAALGGQYILNDQEANVNVLGNAHWWVDPPSNAMPVRCQQGAWAARDRSNLRAPSLTKERSASDAVFH